MPGLFNSPHSAYLSYLRHLTFAQPFHYINSTFLPALVSVLSQLPPANVLETLVVEVLAFPYSGLDLANLVLRKKGDMMVFLAFLTRSQFPSLNKVTVTIIVPKVSGASVSADRRLQQLTEQKEELEGMKWDFGSLFIDIKHSRSSHI